MLTLGHLPTIFRANKGSQQIPLPDLFDYSSRSGLNLVDAIGGSNAAILGGKVARFTNTGEYIVPQEFTLLDGESMTITIKPFVNSRAYNPFLAKTGTLISWLAFRGNVPTYMVAYGIKLDGSGYAGGPIAFATSFFTGNYITLTIRIDGTRLYVRRGDTNEEKYRDIGSPFYMAFNRIGGYDATDYFSGGISSIVSARAVYYFNNLYNSVTGIAATNNGITFPLITTATPQSTTDALTDGYFQLSGGEQVVKAQFTLPVGAVNHVGGQVHNLISSFVDFPTGSSMDRSNTTIFNATCRASIYYDSSNPRRWHVSELNYDTMQTYLQSAYTNTRFASIKTNYLNQLYIDRFFAFAAPISGKTLTYYLTLIGK